MVTQRVHLVRVGALRNQPFFRGLHFDPIEKRPAFGSYRSRLEGRDAYLRTTALDDAAGGDGNRA